MSVHRTATGILLELIELTTRTSMCTGAYIMMTIGDDNHDDDDDDDA